MLKALSLTALGILATLIACLSACGALQITTWLIDAQVGALVRKNSHNEIVQRKELRDADNYRCYSPVDDEAWRTQYDSAKACCDGKH